MVEGEKKNSDTGKMIPISEFLLVKFDYFEIINVLNKTTDQTSHLSDHCPLTTDHLKYLTADSNSFISYSPGTFL